MALAADAGCKCLIRLAPLRVYEGGRQARSERRRPSDFRSTDRDSVTGKRHAAPSRRPFALACAVHDQRGATTGSRRERQEQDMSIETIDAAFELRFQSRLDADRAIAFPCDAKGRVDMDALSRSALNDYLYARAFVGREFRRPKVCEGRAAAAGRCTRSTAWTSSS